MQESSEIKFLLHDIKSEGVGQNPEITVIADSPIRDSPDAVDKRLDNILQAIKKSLSLAYTCL